jgi:DsbC/DsbD-like thiol-disulfide interchange protein
MKRIFLPALTIMPLLAMAATPEAASGDHVKVSLISEQSAFVPGTTSWIGVRLTHDPHWHTYWINPGDSGLPTKLTWRLPEGFGVSDVFWPAPTRIAVGDIANFGYTGDIVLPVQVAVPSDAKEGSTVHVSADAKWLVCREECIPGSASLNLDLPVHAITANNAMTEKFFDTARASTPHAATWSGSAHVSGTTVDVVLHDTHLTNGQVVDAFAIDRKIVTNAPPKVAYHPEDIDLTFKKSEYFEAAPAQFNLLVRSSDGTNARTWRVTVPFDAAATPSAK